MLVSGKSVLLGTSNARLFGTIRYWKIPNQNYLLRYWTQFFFAKSAKIFWVVWKRWKQTWHTEVFSFDGPKGTQRKNELTLVILWELLMMLIMMIHDGTILLTHIHFATMINFFSLLYPEKTKNNPSSSYYLIANKRDDKRLFYCTGWPSKFVNFYQNLSWQTCLNTLYLSVLDDAIMS